MANWSTEKATEIVRNLLRQAHAERNPNSGEANEGAAEIIETQAKTIASKYGLDIDKIDIAFVSDAQVVNELGLTPVMNPFLRANARTNLRSLQFEELAKIVADSYGCKCHPNDNGSVTFYGYDFDREISIFMFISLMQISEDFCKLHMKEYRDNVGKPPIKRLGAKPREFPQHWMGDEVFTDSFHIGFRNAIQKTYTKHEIDSQKKMAVDLFFNEKNPFRYRNDYDAPTFGETNQEIIDLGEKVGNGVAKKAKNAPSALATRTPLSSSSKKILDADISYLLLDNSASIRYADALGDLKEGARTFVAQSAKNGFAVGLIKFGEGAKHLLHPQKEIDEKFEKAIEKLNAREGNTDMASALKEAQARLINRRRKRRICLVTDGMPSNRNYTLEIARQAKADGIEIIAIGIGDANEDFLRELASNNKGLLVDKSRLALTMGEMASA